MSDAGWVKRCADISQQARSVLSEGRPRDALPLFEHALALAPLDSNLNWLAGLSGLMSGAFANAAQRFAIADQLTERSQPQIAAHYAAALHCLGEAGSAGEPEATAHHAGYGVLAVYDRVFGALLDLGDETPLRSLILAMLAPQWAADAWWTDEDATRRTCFRALALNEGAAATSLIGRLGPQYRRSAQDFMRLSVEDDIPEHDMPFLPEVPAGLDKLTVVRLSELSAHEHAIRTNHTPGASAFVRLPRQLRRALDDVRAPSPETGQEVDPILFYHALSAGGASFVSAFASLYPMRTKVFDSTAVEALKLTGAMPDCSGQRFVSVHHPVNLDMIITNPALRWTMIRDPIKRIISSYFSSLRSGLIDTSDVDFMAFVDKLEDIPPLHKARNYSMAYWLSVGTGMDPNDVSIDIDKAFTIARDKFDFVGITDFFDASLLISSAMAGNADIPKWRRLAASGAPSRAMLDQTAIGKLEKMFEDEIDLYQRLKQVFLDRYREILPKIDAIGSLELSL